MGDLLETLRAVREGRLSPEDAAAALQPSAEAAELGFARVDVERAARRGRPEAIFCQGKTPEQIVASTRTLLDAGQNALLTRLDATTAREVGGALSGEPWHYSPVSRLATVVRNPVARKAHRVGILCAGTTDLPVAEEAAGTAEFLGSEVERLYDVGVAGLHRLLRHLEFLQGARVLVVVAGMEGALPSVVAGLTSAPVIAVPTSVGYGANLGGVAALLGMLNACAPGIAVVNIDNGFGAGYLADVLNR
jgi:NCAIR mutase (PurE)-related protein